MPDIGSTYLPLDIERGGFTIWLHPASGIRHPASGIRHPVSGIRYLA
jgi:hypothetical protein